MVVKTPAPVVPQVVAPAVAIGCPPLAPRTASATNRLLYDTFTGADDTALADHKPEVGGSWVAVDGTAVLASNMVTLGTGTPVYTMAGIGADFLATLRLRTITDSATQALQFQFRRTDADNYLYLNLHSAGYLDLYKVEGGAATRLQRYTFTYDPGRVYHVTLWASGGDLHGYLDGTLRLDQTGQTFNQTATTVGLKLVTLGAVDTIEILELDTAAARILTPQPYTTLQRDGSDQADLSVVGTYVGSPTAIEARWNGGEWATLDAAPANNVFAGTLSGQAAGQGSLEVRFSDDPTVTHAAAYVGIGDIFIVAGQSNAEGRADNAQSYTHATLKATVYDQGHRWRECTDPTDFEPTQPGPGSPWPALATLIMAATDLPVAFLTVANGATTLVDTPTQWNQGQDTYEAAASAIRDGAAGGACVILWHQGEGDARSGVTQAAYQAALSLMLDNLQTDTGLSTIKLICAQIGRHDPTWEDYLDAIRLAQADRWDNDADILPGPTLHDVALTDVVHFTTDAEIALLAARWWRLIAYALFSGSDGRGPQVSSAARSGTTVTVTFTGGTGSLQDADDPTGWLFTDDGTPIAVTASAANGTDAVDLTLASTPSGVELVSFGSGLDGVGATLCDSGTTPLPPEPFIGQAVT